MVTTHQENNLQLKLRVNQWFFHQQNWKQNKENRISKTEKTYEDTFPQEGVTLYLDN